MGNEMNQSVIQNQHEKKLSVYYVYALVLFGASIVTFWQCLQYFPLPGDTLLQAATIKPALLSLEGWLCIAGGVGCWILGGSDD